MLLLPDQIDIEVAVLADQSALPTERGLEQLGEGAYTNSSQNDGVSVAAACLCPL